MTNGPAGTSTIGIPNASISCGGSGVIVGVGASVAVGVIVAVSVGIRAVAVAICVGEGKALGDATNAGVSGCSSGVTRFGGEQPATSNPSTTSHVMKGNEGSLVLIRPYYNPEAITAAL
jgi:hypothetical protein